MPITIRPASGSNQAPLSALAAALPKAASQVLNTVAFIGRDAAQAEMRRAFTAVSPGILKANQVVKATADNRSASVVIQNSDPAFQIRLNVAMGIEESGGVETPDELGRKEFSLPVAVRTTATGGMPRGYVASLIKQKSTYILHTGKTDTGQRGLYRITGLGKASQRMKLLVLFRKELTYTPKLHWHDAVAKAVSAAMPGAISAVVGQLISSDPASPHASTTADGKPGDGG